MCVFNPTNQFFLNTSTRFCEGIVHLIKVVDKNAVWNGDSLTGSMVGADIEVLRTIHV